jgi:crotonobetainyl-CoA:carnitine CoA-transferase CaiB-like acyl-CoA transferase
VPLAGALDGVRVLDLTDGLAGPVAGMLLGDLGADVIKIGPPGDRAARPGRRVWDRNKRWAGFDPTRDADADALDRLVAGADIVLAGPAQWLGRAPGTAIWVVMPPYLLGETPWGPERESAGLVHAWLGHAWSQASYEDVPVDSVFPLALYMQGIWGATVATALVAGQRRGRRTGRLAVVGGAHGGLLVWPGGFEVRRDEPHMPRPGGPGGALPNYRCYRCGDGAWLFFGAFTTAFIDRGLRAVGAAEVLADPRVGGDPARVRDAENIGWITALLETLFRQRPRAEWVKLLEAADVPVAPVGETGEWLDHEQVQALGLRAELGGAVMPGVFVGLSGTPASLRRAAAERPEAIAGVAWTPRSVAGGTGTDRPAELPLGGLRVLDLGTVIAGPYVGALLGELGAEVLKIERPPGGDEYRTAHAGRGGVGFPGFNRGKRSLMLDLARGGRDVFLGLARSADVVVDNYRPGVAARLGISHDRLAEVNPGITSVSVSAFGDAGPLRHRPGFDPVVQAMSGIMRSQAGQDEADSPVFLTVPVNDVIAAGLGTLGACAALAARASTGRGQQVSVTLCAASCLVQSEHLVRFAGLTPVPGGGRDFPGPGPLDRLYRAADGWVRLAGAGEPEGDLAGLADVVAGLPVAEVLRRAASVGVPAVRARQAPELAGDHQLIRHGLLTVIEPDECGAALVAGPGHGLELPDLNRPAPGPPPRPGEHSRAILLEAGLDPGEVEALERAGVVFSGAPVSGDPVSGVPGRRGPGVPGRPGPGVPGRPGPGVSGQVAG